MADLALLKLVVDGQSYVIPEVSETQRGTFSPEDYKKFKEMVTTGGEANKLEEVKVNGVALKIADKAVDILIKESTENGKLDVNGTNVLIHGLAALAYKANVSQSDLEEALATVITNASTNAAKVPGLESTLETLQGSGVGSIKKMIDDAFNTFVTETTDNGVIDKFAEMVNWFAEMGDEASNGAQILADIQAIQAILAGIGGTSEPATVAAYVTQELGKLQISNITGLQEALNKKVDAEEGKVLSSNDYTNAEKAKLATIDEGAKKVTYAYDSDSQTLTLAGLSAASA